MRRAITAAAGILGFFAVTGVPAANAQTNAAAPAPDLNVTASVTQTCSVDAVGQLAFGELTEATTEAVAQTTLELSCTMSNATPVAIFIDNGLHYDAFRRMKGSGTHTIRYQVCSTHPCTNWSDTGEAATITGTATKGVWAVVGSTFLTQDAIIADNYSDTLIVTMSY